MSLERVQPAVRAHGVQHAQTEGRRRSRSDAAEVGVVAVLVRVDPPFLTAPSVVGHSALILAALLLGEEPVSHEHERRPPLAHRPLPEELRLGGGAEGLSTGDAVPLCAAERRPVPRRELEGSRLEGVPLGLHERDRQDRLVIEPEAERGHARPRGPVGMNEGAERREDDREEDQPSESNSGPIPGEKQPPEREEQDRDHEGHQLLQRPLRQVLPGPHRADDEADPRAEEDEARDPEAVLSHGVRGAVGAVSSRTARRPTWPAVRSRSVA